MHERNRQECRGGEHRDCDGRDPWIGLEQQQIERGHVPYRRETAKIVLLHLHLAVGEIERAADDDRDRAGKRQPGRHQAARHHDEGRDEHIGEEIDHQIEHVARPARQPRGDFEPPRDHAIDAVDEQGGTEQEEHFRPVALDRSQQREQRQRRARRREDVHPERQHVRERRRRSCLGVTHQLPQSSRTSSAERPAKFQLRPKARTREVSARAIVTSLPTQ
jgi:hypothetical protein